MGARAILDSLLVEHPVTDTFKRWFSGSKVVDSRGNPKMVYHGTDSEDFETFERTEDIGFHFGTARQASARRCVTGSGEGYPAKRGPVRIPK